jgi:uncharacterized protein with HEPN domain
MRKKTEQIGLLLSANWYKLVHDYMGIDNVAVWLTIERTLPGARERLVEIRDQLD